MKRSFNSCRVSLQQSVQNIKQFVFNKHQNNLTKIIKWVRNCVDVEEDHMSRVKNLSCQGKRSKVHNVSLYQDFFNRYPLIADKFHLNKVYIPHPELQQHPSKNNNRIVLKSSTQIDIQDNKMPKMFALIFQEQHNNQHYQALCYQGQIDELQQKNGTGKAIFSNGDVYQGTWKDNLIHGHGKFTSQGEQTIYEGEFKEWKKQGQGVIKSSNQTQKFIYTGSWKNDLFDGKGVIKYEDQSSYEGEFQKGQQQGNGIYRTKNMTYEGSWKDGFMQGSGNAKWFSQNGKIASTYSGEYKKGKKHGFGEYTTKNGKILRGQWFQGKFRPGTNSYVIN